jgi:hypothetical protein
MNELLLNPNLSVKSISREGRVCSYSLVALVKGRGRLNSNIEILNSDPDVIAVLEALVDNGPDINMEVEFEVEPSACEALVDLGVLVGVDEISRPVVFSCRLDADGEQIIAPSTVNPSLIVMSFQDFVESEKGLTHVLERCSQIALVVDSVTCARYPYWLDDAECALLKRLVPGALPPPDLEAVDISRLSRAGILVNEHVIAASRQRVHATADQFARRGYAELPKILPPLQIAALCRYYRSLLNEGHIATHDRQVDLRSSQHNEPLMLYYHRQLCELFSCITRQTMKPSYGYFASYRHGAVLKKHVDREQCKFTASLLLDYVAGPLDDQAWPLYLELPTGEQVDICLEPGGCVLYRGCELPHYRYAFRGQRSASFFLHYVDEDFSGQLY